jgi:hypothetical protein
MPKTTHKSRLTADQIVEWRDAGKQLIDIAAAAGISASWVAKIYNAEVKRRRLAAKINPGPLSDSQPLKDIVHMLPARFCRVMEAVVEQGTVGDLRRAPDALLMANYDLGPKTLEQVRIVLGVPATHKKGANVRSIQAAILGKK